MEPTSYGYSPDYTDYAVTAPIVDEQTIQASELSGFERFYFLLSRVHGIYVDPETAREMYESESDESRRNSSIPSVDYLPGSLLQSDVLNLEEDLTKKIEAIISDIKKFISDRSVENFEKTKRNYPPKTVSDLYNQLRNKSKKSGQDDEDWRKDTQDALEELYLVAAGGSADDTEAEEALRSTVRLLTESRSDPGLFNMDRHLSYRYVAMKNLWLLYQLRHKPELLSEFYMSIGNSEKYSFEGSSENEGIEIRSMREAAQSLVSELT